MPPRTKITKSAIREAALTVVREHGAAACNARAVAAKLSCSTQPIFSHYRSMEEVRHDVIVRAYELYRAYLAREMSSGNYPPYKASGIAYIRFAKEERELFKLLFMRDRSGEKISSKLARLISSSSTIRMVFCWLMAAPPLRLRRGGADF